MEKKKIAKVNVAAILFPIKATELANYLDTKLRVLKNNHCLTRFAAINKNVLSYPAEIPTVFTPG